MQVSVAVEHLNGSGSQPVLLKSGSHGPMGIQWPHVNPMAPIGFPWTQIAIGPMGIPWGDGIPMGPWDSHGPNSANLFATMGDPGLSIYISIHIYIT